MRSKSFTGRPTSTICGHFKRPSLITSPVPKYAHGIGRRDAPYSYISVGRAGMDDTTQLAFGRYHAASAADSAASQLDDNDNLLHVPLFHSTLVTQLAELIPCTVTEISESCLPIFKPER